MTVIILWFIAFIPVTYIVYGVIDVYIHWDKYAKDKNNISNYGRDGEYDD